MGGTARGLLHLERVGDYYYLTCPAFTSSHFLGVNEKKNACNIFMTGYSEPPYSGFLEVGALCSPLPVSRFASIV